MRKDKGLAKFLTFIGVGYAASVVIFYALLTVIVNLALATLLVIVLASIGMFGSLIAVVLTRKLVRLDGVDHECNPIMRELIRFGNDGAFVFALLLNLSIFIVLIFLAYYGHTYTNLASASFLALPLAMAGMLVADGANDLIVLRRKRML